MEKKKFYVAPAMEMTTLSGQQFIAVSGMGTNAGLMPGGGTTNPARSPGFGSGIWLNGF